MAFIRTQMWEEVQQPAMPLAALPPAAQRSARNSGALLFTALVHALLLWVLATRLAPAPPDAGSAQRGAPAPGLLSFDLAESESAADASESVQPPAAEPSVATEVDSAIETAIPAEWSAARIRLPEPSAPQAPAPSPAPQALASGTAGQGHGDGGVYDPYAGAAPLRRSSDAPLLGLGAASARIAPGEFAAHFQLDEAALDIAARRLASLFPAWVGSAAGVRITVSPAGFVISAEAGVRGTAHDPEMELAAILVGLKLFKVISTPRQPLSTQMTQIRFGRTGQVARGVQ